MISQPRPVSLRFTADPIAQSVRSFIAAPSVRSIRSSEATPAAGGSMDPVRLYPALFAPAPQPSFPVRATRALAFRLGVIGTVFATMAFLHH